MAHKVNPKIFRIGTTTTWNSKWFVAKRFIPKHLREDVMIRKFLTKRLVTAGIAKIEIERTTHDLVVTLYSAKPGVVIGRGGTGVEEITRDLKKEVMGNPSASVKVNIKEVDDPKLSAPLVAQTIASDIERRIPFRRASKRALESVSKAGAKGVKIIVSGRLDGAEISRTERFLDGKVPLHTLRANIEYGRHVAFTTYGAVGIKVWVYKGEVFQEKGKALKKALLQEEAEERQQPADKPRRRFGRPRTAQG